MSETPTPTVSGAPNLSRPARGTAASWWFGYGGRSVRRAVLAINARQPLKHSPAGTIPSFFAAWLTSELAGPMLAIDAADTLFQVASGRVRRPSDWAKVGLSAAAGVGLWSLLRQGLRVDDDLEPVLSEFRSPAELSERPKSDRLGELLPVFNGKRRATVVRNEVYATTDNVKLRLDVYRPRDEDAGPGRVAGPAPALIYVHGGAWIIGDKSQQGIPLLNHLASCGWTCFNINYRLSPKFRAPAHLVDVKRAISWVRTNAATYGIDPSFIALAGNSAGGHLCALAALTANDPEFQPGFEDDDTSIQAAVPFYGVYDMLDRNGVNGGRQFTDFLEKTVFGQRAEDNPARFRAYSPLDQVHPQAPPMMIVHGEKDVLVPVEGARIFRDRLAAVSREPVLYAELTGAQHAYDVFASPRTMRSIEWVQQFLAECWERHRVSAPPIPESAVIAAGNAEGER